MIMSLFFLDVFGQKSNISLVFDFMDTDLEIIVKDSNIVLTPANVKAYMIMTLKGKILKHNYLSMIYQSSSWVYFITMEAVMDKFPI